MPWKRPTALAVSLGGLAYSQHASAQSLPLAAFLPAATAVADQGLLAKGALPFDHLQSAVEIAENSLAPELGYFHFSENQDEPVFTPAALPQSYSVAAPAIGTEMAGAPVIRLNPTGRDITLSSPMRDGEFVLPEVGFILGADDTVRVETVSLIAALKNVLAEDRISDLQTDIAGKTHVPTSELEKFGIRIAYDPATIGLTIQIVAENRLRRDISLRQTNEAAPGNVIEPAGVSGYINFRSFADYVWSGGETGLQAPTSLIDSAIRYRGFVLENEATLRLGSDSGRTISREATRLVYDDRRRYIRFAAGDLVGNGRGFSGSSQIAGVSATRVYSIVDPLRIVQPAGDRTLVITRPSTVEALINGQSVRRIRLDPGSYNVSDFPFVQGTNNVQFNIEDDAGGRQTIAFSQFFDRTLLDPGLTEFSLQAGVFAPFSGGGRDYQFGEPAASGWFRRGMSDTLTLGGNFNVRKEGGTVGAEATIATALGIVGTDVAFSSIDNIGSGFAVNVGVQRTFGANGSRARSLSASAEYRSPKFATPGTLIADNRISWNLATAYAQPIGESQFVSLSGNYAIARGQFRNESNARLTYGYAINSKYSLTVDATYDDRNFFGREYGVRATLLIRLGRRSSGVAEVDSLTKRARLGYQTSRGEGVGSWTASGDLDVGKEDIGFNGGFSYTANRAELSLAHTTVYELSSQRSAAQRTSLRFGTALAFADGKFAISRPIFDSFAMVAPHKSLKGATVVVDPRDEGYSAKSGVFGPAVEPDLAAYIRRTIAYDVPNAPTGYDLGAGSAKISPPYRGGYLVVAGSDYSVTALGTLLGTDGAPISLLAGTATELGVDAGKSVMIFTNRTGRFGMTGLRAGKWRIDMPTEPPTVVEIEIPNGALGVVRLGDVILKDAK